MNIKLSLLVISLLLSACASELSKQQKDVAMREAIEKGKIYLKFKKFAKAERSFIKATEFAPNHYYSFFQAGNAARLDGDYENAMRYYRRAISLNPSYLPAYGNMAIILRNTKRYEDAIVVFERVLEINQHELRALDHLADIYYDLKKYDKCQQYMTKFETAVSQLNQEQLTEKTKQRIEKSRRMFVIYRNTIKNLSV